MLVALCFIVFAGCGSAPPPPSSDLYYLQTRSFDIREGVDQTSIMQLLIGVLLDEGYILRETSAPLGVLTAFQEESVGPRKLLGIFPIVEEDHHRMTELQAHVQRITSLVKVRLVLTRRVVDSQGEVVSSSVVQTEGPYLHLFDELYKVLPSAVPGIGPIAPM